MTSSETAVAFAIFSVVVSHSFYMVKWFYGVTKVSHERYRTDTLVLIQQQAQDQQGVFVHL